MTREEILQTFSDINHAYNNSTKYDTLKRMLDELTESCEDCISRTQAIKAMDELENEDIEAYGCSIPEGFDGERARQALCLLPSIQPKPKTGHWIVVSDGYGDSAYICECSECKDTVWVYKNADRQWNYCSNCGAKMESEG